MRHLRQSQAPTAFIDTDCTIDSSRFNSIACYLEDPEAVRFGASPVIPANAGVRKNGQQLPTRRVGGIWILLNIYFFACGMPLFSNAAWSRLQTGTGIVVAIWDVP
jgi:hypothetical protein